MHKRFALILGVLCVPTNLIMKPATFRKLCLLFLGFNLFSFAVKAQIRVGVKIGLNESEINTSNNQFVSVGGNNQTLRNFPKAGFNGGLLLSIPLSKKFSLQPEAVYSTQGADGKPTVAYAVSATEVYNFNYVNIPLLLKQKLPLGIFLETGPQLGLLVKADIDESVVGTYTTTHYSVKNQFKSTDVAWVLGAGYLSPFNVGFDIRYNLGLTDFSNTAPTSGMQTAPIQNGSIKNSVVQIGVFVVFGK
jgi:hypothetical protein